MLVEGKGGLLPVTSTMPVNMIGNVQQGLWKKEDARHLKERNGLQD